MTFPNADEQPFSADDAFAFLYHELRAAAHRRLNAERPDHTLSSTALVHEVYLRLPKDKQIWTDEMHFISIASRMMRQILVDHARGLRTEKRGGGEQKISLEESVVAGLSSKPLNVEALDEALTELANLDMRQSQVVELRFFGGLTTEQIAGVLSVSEKTVKRDWAMARVWLRHRLDQSYLEAGGAK